MYIWAVEVRQLYFEIQTSVCVPTYSFYCTLMCIILCTISYSQNHKERISAPGGYVSLH